jgi:Carboxypeptidase regulatory-like domain
MNARFEAKFNMYRTVEQHCNAHEDIVKNYLDFDTCRQLLGVKVGVLVGIVAALKQVDTGVTVDKGVSKQNLCRMTAGIASLAFAYATRVNDYVLRDAVDFSYSDLMRFKDDELAPVVSNIYEAVGKRAKELAGTGLSATMLAALTEATDNYSYKVPKPRGAKAVKVNKQDNLKQIVKEIDDLLKFQMDKLVVAMENDHPDFVAVYRQARFIYNPATRRTQLKGKVLSEVGKKPVAAVTIELQGPITVVAQTDETGSFIMKPLMPGTYKMVVRAEGYAETAIEAIEVKMGRINKATVRIKPAA